MPPGELDDADFEVAAAEVTGDVLIDVTSVLCGVCRVLLDQRTAPPLDVDVQESCRKENSTVVSLWETNGRTGGKRG
jgi:hypothetical protein